MVKELKWVDKNGIEVTEYKITDKCGNCGSKLDEPITIPKETNYYCVKCCILIASMN